MASTSEPGASFQLAFEGSEAGLGQLHAMLGEVWQALEGHPGADIDARWRTLFTTAVAEVAANIIEHALAPESGGIIDLRIDVVAGGLRARFVDHGRASDAPPPGEIAMPGDTGQESGRGLAIAMLAVDCLSYARRDDQNSWELVKRF